MTEFTDYFAYSRTLGGTWVTGEERPDYFPGHEDLAYHHQLETREAIDDPGTEVVVNTNPTGAGKTRSWVVPTIRAGESSDGRFVVAAYPTNALLQDQKRAIRSLVADYYRSAHETVADATVVENEGGETVIEKNGEAFPLSDLVRTISGGTTRGATDSRLNEAAEDADIVCSAGFPLIVLTTPDTLTLLGVEAFSDPDVGVVPAYADAVVIDEFHLANPRGKRVLPFLLDLYKRLQRDDQYTLVFLSATPDDAYVERLRRAFDVDVVGRPIETEPRANSSNAILPTARLHVQSNRMFQNGEWLADRATQLLDWYEGDGQLLVIVDSIREVETVYESLDSCVEDLSVGRIYGWKRRGRQTVIEESDVIVGNTAMEVGVDFAEVSRVVCTAYDAASAVQRIGRMRARAGLEEYEIALLTTEDTQGEILRQCSEGRIERGELTDVFGDTLDPVGVAPYYDLLVATFVQYLWSESRLGERLHEADESTYRAAMADHFGDAPVDVYGGGSDITPDDIWTETEDLLEKYGRWSNWQYPMFEEMYGFRSGSLTVTVLDENDPDEPIKVASLGTVVRNRTGRILRDEEEFLDAYESRFGTPVERDLRLLEQSRGYSCGHFLSTGLRDDPGDYSIQQYGKLAEWRDKHEDPNHSPVSYSPDTVENPRLEVSNDIRGDPGWLDLDNEVLAQYVDSDPWRAREAYNLGRYASLVSVGDEESFALWQDAILVHATEMTEYLNDRIE